MEIEKIISEVKQKIDDRGGLKAVYFIGLGGSLAAIYPGKYLLTTEAKSFPTLSFTSNEFIYSDPKGLDERCIVILCSLKGTAETVEALKYANSKGAITIAMTGTEESEMFEHGQYSVIYSSGDDQIYSQSNQSYSLRLGFEILKQFEGYEHYEKAMDAFTKLDDIFVDAKKRITERAIKFALDFKDEDMFYILASGPCWGTGYSMASCHLMEMQWKNASMIHSGEFFHGPFEITDDKPVMVLIKSIGKTRYLDERVETFLNKFAKKLFIMDARDTELSTLDSSVAEYFSSVIMLPIERFVVSKMADMRDHSMDKRKYMWQFDY